MLEAAVPVLNVGADRLHFLDEGAGRPIVFIHGSCGSGAQWKSLASDLQEDYRTLCVDLFGCGQSQPWPIEREWTIADDERAINAVLDFLGEPVHLVAHSAGGRFTYPTIKGYRDRILSLTLFEPVHFQLLRQDGDPLFSEPQGMASDYRAAMDAGRREEAIEGFVDQWAKARGVWNGLPEPAKAMMRIGADRLYHEWRTIWVDEPTRDDLAAIDLPVLLFKGAQTIRSMHQVCEILKLTLPNCRTIEIEDAGHMSPFTHAPIALPSLREYLARSVQ